LRIQTRAPKKKGRNWTGEKGKQVITRKSGKKGEGNPKGVGRKEEGWLTSSRKWKAD